MTFPQVGQLCRLDMSGDYCAFYRWRLSGDHQHWEMIVENWDVMECSKNDIVMILAIGKLFRPLTREGLPVGRPRWAAKRFYPDGGAPPPSEKFIPDTGDRTVLCLHAEGVTALHEQYFAPLTSSLHHK